jgi:uncharacterized protein (TIGR02421 family)
MTPEKLLRLVKRRLAAARPIRRALPGGGRLHIDRPLPFLCVYRPRQDADAGTADLVRTQASYLIAPVGADVQAMVDGIVDALAATCGACLLVDLWAGSDRVTAFRIHTAHRDRLATMVDALASALAEMAPRLAVEVVVDEPALASREGVLSIGLEIPPIYRSDGALYPQIQRALAHDLAHALQRTFFEFTRVQTPARPEHFHMMGRRHLVRAVRQSDQALAMLDESFDFLLAVTPINSDAAWQEFRESKLKCMPTFHYRMLEIDPDIGKRRLYELPIERLEDPVLAQLLRDKRREVDRKLGMLDDRDTVRFRYASLQIYPAVEDSLLAEAETILAKLPARTAPAEPEHGRCDARAFAIRARAELARYRETLPALAATVAIRADVTSLLVSNGNVLVPAHLDVAARRVEALLQHEVGTHAVTYANGALQPLKVLATGLAQYEALQEGLAMFAEYLACGLDVERLRLIAARVIAVRRLVEDVTFPDVVRELVERCGTTTRAAFGIAVRVFRGGGLTKDAIYLRGLLALLAHLKANGAIEPLLVGKLAFEQIALVEELVRREVLRPPALRPRWLDIPAAAERLARARAGLTPIDLVIGRS